MALGAPRFSTTPFAHGRQVGNDAVDQLSKFNGRLADLARRPDPHVIDGIVLTKMDTIDDKARLLHSMQGLRMCSDFLASLSVAT